MTGKLNMWLEKLPMTLETRLDNAIGKDVFSSFTEIPLEYALEEALEVVADYADTDSELYANLEGENGEEKELEAKEDLSDTMKYVKKLEKELAKKKEEIQESEGINNPDSDDTTGKSEEGVVDDMSNKEKELAVKGEAEQNEAKPKEKENTGDKFKWLNRPKATMTAVMLKNEEGMTAEDACKKVMNEYEGVYFHNPKLISDKRWKNFIERVEADKTYKKSKNETPEYAFIQTKIELLKEQGELTELQAIVLDGLFNLLAPYEVGYSNAEIVDIADSVGLKPEQVKGTVGHLIKKGYVYTDEGEEKTTLVYIDSDKYELYNTKAEAGSEEIEVVNHDEVTEEIEKLLGEEKLEAAN